MNRRLCVAALVLSLSLVAPHAFFQTASAQTASTPHVLTAAEATPFLPPAVFFRGQSASVQTRNSGGVQFSKDTLMLATLVDTSGYSSTIQEKYQAYLITEVPLDFAGHHLPPGAYGCGFIANDNFLVMDIGGHDLFTIKSARDTEMRRPMPLQVLAGPAPNRYRLYASRSYIEFTKIDSH